MPDLWKYTRAQSDTDAETFFAACVAAGTTLSAEQKTAIYGLVGGLKQMSLWSKMTALYPFVGGIAGCHAINLKTPGTYNITWSGTVTHNSNGITGNGSTGYGDTGLVPSTTLSQNSVHISIYSRTNSAVTSVDLGVADGSKQLYEQIRYTDNKAYLAANSVTGVATVALLDSTWLFTISRTSSSSLSAFKGSVKVGSLTSASTSMSTKSLFVCALNNSGSAASFSARNYSFASIGSGLSDSDAQNLSLLVQSYQSALGRAV